MLQINVHYSCHWSFLIPPENIRKPEVQGVSKEICGMKWVNKVNLTLVSDKGHISFNDWINDPVNLQKKKKRSGGIKKGWGILNVQESCLLDALQRHGELMNCFCGMVDRRKALNLISSRDLLLEILTIANLQHTACRA